MSYCLPSVIRKAEGGRLPERIRPVFRYETNLPVGPLWDTICGKFTGQYLLGLAKLRSQDLSFPLLGVYAAMDGASPQILSLWQRHRLTIDNF